MKTSCQFERELPTVNESLKAFFAPPVHPGADATPTQLFEYRKRVAEIATRNALLKVHPEAAAPILKVLNP